MKSIGILGGMGPAASAVFYSMIVEKFQKEGAVQDTDFARIILHSIALAGFDETGIVSFDLAKDQLLARY